MGLKRICFRQSHSKNTALGSSVGYSRGHSYGVGGTEENSNGAALELRNEKNLEGGPKKKDSRLRTINAISKIVKIQGDQKKGGLRGAPKEREGGRGGEASDCYRSKKEEKWGLEKEKKNYTVEHQPYRKPSQAEKKAPIEGDYREIKMGA